MSSLPSAPPTYFLVTVLNKPPMKSLLLFLSFIGFFSLISTVTFAQECIGTFKGIATNPDAPSNPEKSAKENLYFNWLVAEYAQNSAYIAGNTLSSPFDQDQNILISHFELNNDRFQVQDIDQALLTASDHFVFGRFFNGGLEYKFR